VPTVHKIAQSQITFMNNGVNNFSEVTTVSFITNALCICATVHSAHAIRKSLHVAVCNRKWEKVLCIEWFPGGKAAGREADHSPPLSAKIKKMWV
jgi:hypothetical protein